MKKYWKMLLCAAIGVNAFTACEDVPEPYNIPTEQGTETPVTPTGIEATCAEAVELTKALTDGGTSSEVYTITGYITAVDGEVSKNQQTFWMADTPDGGRVFEAYWANLPSGVSEFKTGSKVKITGKLTKFVNKNTGNMTAEIKNATVEILEEGGGDTPAPTGIEVSCAEAVELTNALTDSGVSAETYTVTGYITKVVSAVSRNQQSFWMADTKDGGEVFEAYYANLPNGVSEFKVGSKVKITGQLTKYVNNSGQVTPEIKNATVEILEDSGSEPSGDAKGSGTREDPYNVVAAIANNSGTAWVSGYIVGWIDGKTLAEGARFNGSSTVATNIIIADNPDETNIANCMPVQLPAGDARAALNLMDNPGNYKKQVTLQGSLEKYFGTAGLKSVSAYSIDGSATPDPQPAGEAKGSGTLEDPYNSVAANNIASALAKDAKTDVAYYIKGKVVSVKEQFGTQYGNATVFISDDGTAAGQFQVFRAFYLGNRKWTTGDAQLQKGDEIVVYARLTNYMGNTPESVAGKEGQDHGYLYSINGQTEGGTVEPTPQPGGDTKTLADFTNGDFETWTDDSQPTGWKSESTASNATLEKSTDAHGGSYAVCVKGTTSGNKRIAYNEIALEPGTYNCAFWTKAAASSTASLCPGYAAIGTGNLVYYYDKGDDDKNRYVNDIGDEWQQVTYSFTLKETTTVCLVIMNSKTTGSDLLIDDFTITKQ